WPRGRQPDHATAPSEERSRNSVLVQRPHHISRPVLPRVAAALDRRPCRSAVKDHKPLAVGTRFHGAPTGSPETVARPRLGRIEARTGLRMMPTFPRSPLSFRTAGLPRYG